MVITGVVITADSAVRGDGRSQGSAAAPRRDTAVGTSGSGSGEMASAAAAAAAAR
jgi:hypothetical protein